MKHTPGPWYWFTSLRLDKIDPAERYVKESGEHLRHFTGSNGQGFALTVGLSEERDEANANLIAAAPDLAIVARAAFRLLTPDQCATLSADEEAAFGRIESIAKAEGR